jgi:hypothetical protein
MAVDEVRRRPVELGDLITEVRSIGVDELGPGEMSLGKFGRCAYIDDDNRRIGGERSGPHRVDELNGR